MTDSTTNIAPSTHEAGEGCLVIRGELPDTYHTVLSPEALAFVAELEMRFGRRRLELLERRRERQSSIDAGERPNFLPETRHIRSSEWQVGPLPKDLLDRRVEITGPVDRKMIINALNSGANVFMADFEDSSSPTWANVIEGQINLYDAVRGSIEYRHPKSGKHYRLAEDTATLMVRPRGWHLEEKHALCNGRPVSASIFDFGLFFFHNARELIAKGSGPYFYLPKLENHREARLWNDLFLAAQDLLSIPAGTIKATVLIEHILAAFEMDEILHELRDHSAGLNCGRWDYIFSFIKVFRNNPSFVLPDRNSVGMDRHFLSSYSKLLIKTCHRRGVHAMGGMAAQIPIKDDAKRNQAALDCVLQDKRREVNAGHDGTWVAHPGLVEMARAEFDAVMHGPHQIRASDPSLTVTGGDLLQVPVGRATEMGLRKNLYVGLRYLESWLAGHGCVPINNLMEDAATCEISRVQIWQWLRHKTKLSDGRVVNIGLVKTIMKEEVKRIREDLGEDRMLAGRFEIAIPLFLKMLEAQKLLPFMTSLAYRYI